MGDRRRGWSWGAAVTLVVLVSGCGDGGDDSDRDADADRDVVTASPTPTPTPTPTPAPEVVEDDEVPWFSLEEGQCLATLPGDDESFTDVEVADCAGKHQAEVVGSIGRSAIQDSESRCVDAARRYVGGDPDKSGLSVTWLESDSTGSPTEIPTDLTQLDPYRYVLICMVIPANGGEVTGSAES
ncbi:MAG: hypothetical protein NTX33_19300 [Propionibacteriales bacterium]|nr:hypothetical protein [Propionibacteriales bacterium]